MGVLSNLKGSFVTTMKRSIEIYIKGKSEQISQYIGNENINL